MEELLSLCVPSCVGCLGNDRRASLSVLTIWKAGTAQAVRDKTANEYKLKEKTHTHTLRGDLL